jgi:hypothetical protein
VTRKGKTRKQDLPLPPIPKKRNPQDATVGRNIRAARERVIALTARVRNLEKRVKALERAS